MNELSVGALNILSLAVSLVMLIIGLIVWFFVNRASNRTHEQIELLEEMLDQQKRQTALLRRLCEANEPDVVKEEPETSKEAVEEDDFIRLVAER
ncbi:hypothetical protein EHN07_18315 [Buttiauxella warmboldiae]|uniref:Uncharacterized protein YebO n=1 Tax=Buttiauxella warmboldiae TaxID=82993 RepID=A0A3N5DL97_9ENTR|nr:YebO family protein [Buttiauxella warmboldiae]RPH21463.1 hypothetical protein EHN07_18315 [Buttiauxella warmboldiae]